MGVWGSRLQGTHLLPGWGLVPQQPAQGPSATLAWKTGQKNKKRVGVSGAGGVGGASLSLGGADVSGRHPGLQGRGPVTRGPLLSQPRCRSASPGSWAQGLVFLRMAQVLAVQTEQHEAPTTQETVGAEGRPRALRTRGRGGSEVLFCAAGEMTQTVSRKEKEAQREQGEGEGEAGRENGERGVGCSHDSVTSLPRAAAPAEPWGAANRKVPWWPRPSAVRLALALGSRRPAGRPGRALQYMSL